MATLIRQTWDWLCFSVLAAYLLLVWLCMLMTRRLDPRVSAWKVCGGLCICLGRFFTRPLLALARVLRLSRRLPVSQHLS